MGMEVEIFREHLVEALAEADDEMATMFLQEQEPSPEELIAALHRATVRCQIVPVLCGSSLRNKGVQRLIDAVVDYLPSPLEVPPFDGEDPETGETVKIEADADGPFAALLFKAAADVRAGKLSYVRVYSGELARGSTVLNPRTGRRERVNRILRMHANRREEVEQMRVGDIVAALGLNFSTTGDTLCDPKRRVLLERIAFPDPVISVAIEPRTKADEEKLVEALSWLDEEDPTFSRRTDRETGQLLISGMGELHLEVIRDRLEREFNVEANIGTPQVAYKETVTATGRGEGKFIRQTGGRGHYGHVVLEVAPGETGTGLAFRDDTRGGPIPQEFMKAVEEGVEEALDSGVVAGFPVVDVVVRAVDGSSHEVDSSDIAYRIAASVATREAVRKAQPVLKEPIMLVGVTTPEDYTGAVTEDLGRRRAQIEGVKPEPGAAQSVKAFVPLATMFGYATDLRSLTQGRGTYTMEPARYDLVPPEVQRELVA
jgi:elongation factor G